MSEFAAIPYEGATLQALYVRPPAAAGARHLVRVLRNAGAARTISGWVAGVFSARR